MTDIRSILQQAGFQGSALDTAQAIAMAESGGNPNAYNGNAATGDNSYGLFQINMLGGMGAERRKLFGLSSNNDLYNPVTNAEIAFHLSKGGTDFTPWSTYKNGAYRTFLGNGNSILAGAESPGDPTPLVPGNTAPKPSNDNNSMMTAFENATNQLGGDTGMGAAEPLTQSPQDFASWIASLRSRVGPMTLADISKPLNIPGLNGSSTASSDVSSGPWTDGSLMPDITGQSNGFDPSLGTGGTGGATGQAATIINWAKQFVGTPYVWGGNSLTSGVDCSGLVQQVFKHFGINLPRLAADQANSGTAVSLQNLQPGDLVAWDDNPYQRGADHIAIYVGNGNILEAPRPGLSVRVRQLGTWSADSQAWGVQILPH